MNPSTVVVVVVVVWLLSLDIGAAALLSRQLQSPIHFKQDPIRNCANEANPISDLSCRTPPTFMNPQLDYELGSTMSIQSLGSCDCAGDGSDGSPSDLVIGNHSVLVLGDSISGYQLGHAAFLKEVFEQHGIGFMYICIEGWNQGGSCGSSCGAAQCAREFVGGPSGDYVDDRYDAILFQSALHDIAPEYYGYVSPEQYAANMRSLYDGIKSTVKPDCKFVFQLGTPVQNGTVVRKNEDLMALNEVAVQVFHSGSAALPILDLYKAIVDYCQTREESKNYPSEPGGCPALQMDGNVHMTDEGKQFTGSLAASAVLVQLGMPPLDMSRWGVVATDYL